MKSRLELVSAINITSLADISITLLMIFIIAGISAALSRATIDVNLPYSKAAQPQAKEGITVTITKDQKIYIEQELVRLEDFEKIFNRYLAKEIGPMVYLKADEAISYGLALTVVGKIKTSGVENLGLVAEPMPKKR